MIRRIAVLRALFLGDFICAQPALRALKTRFPSAEITLIGLPWIEPFLRRYPCIDHFLPFPGCQGVAEVPFRPDVTRAFLDAQRGKFDLAIQMHGSGPASNDLVAGLGARVSLGYTPPGVPSPLSRPVPYPGDHIHEARKWLQLVAHVGAPGTPQPDLPVLAEEEETARELLASLDPKRPIVAIHAGARDPARRWPPERFAALADQLWDMRDAQVVLTGTKDDAESVALVRRACRAPIVDLCGKTSIGELAAVLDRVDLLVTNDSGPSHVAWARGVPSVVLFGPTNPLRWAPLNERLHRAILAPEHDLQKLFLRNVWPTVDTMLAHARARRSAA